MSQCTDPSHPNNSGSTVLTFPGQKGGVGKTTTCWGFAYGLAERGYRVLAVDLDPQEANLSALVAADKDDLVGSYELMSLAAPAADCIQHVGGEAGFDFIAANPSLASVRFDKGDISGLYRLREALEEVRGSYDYVLLDVPPGFDELTANAYIAADDMVIPVEADYMASLSLNDLTKKIRATTKHANPSVTIAGIVVGNYRNTTTFQSGMAAGIEKLGAGMGTKVLGRGIRQAVAVQEAQGAHMGIGEHAPGSAVAGDFDAAIDDYLAESGR